jgi:hypothetical protein
VNKERFYAKTRIFDGCILWTGAKNEHGYGRFGIDGITYYAHRVAYVLAVGEIPEGTSLDHKCRRRACINAEHLEPVTQRENVRRSPVHFASKNLAKLECPRGHAYTTFKRADGAKHRRCDVCIKEANDLRSDAYKFLGISQRQYLRQYGASRSTAEAIIAAYRKESA